MPCFKKRTLCPLFSFLLLFVFACAPDLSKTLITRTDKFIESVKSGDLSLLESLYPDTITAEQRNDIITFFSNIDKESASLFMENRETAVISYKLIPVNDRRIIKINMEKDDNVWRIKGTFDVSLIKTIDKIELKK